MEEDTLSLSELPLIRSDSREDQSISSFDDDDDDDYLFEFFSGDIAAAASSYPADKIIFWGKDIANNKEAQIDREARSEKEFKTIMKAPKSSLSFNKVGATSGTSSRHQQARNHRFSTSQQASQNYGYITNKQANKYELSILATPEKQRWYFFVLGIGRHLMEIEPRPLKSRHSQNGPATMFQSVSKGEVIKGKGRRSWKGSWGLLKRLGCTDERANRVVMASLACMPEMQSAY